MPKRTCSVDGCGRKHKSKGFCDAHWQRWTKTGDARPGVPIKTRAPRECTIDGCSKRLFSKGFCRAHWMNWKHSGDPLKFRECIIDGCSRYAPAGKRGWCLLHYTRWSKHGDTGEAASRIWEPPREPAAGHRWCSSCRAELPLAEFHREKASADGIARVCRDCRRDAKVAEFYGISGAMYRSLLNEQGGVCRICRKPETATHQSGTLRRLSVDHDHRCCPGKKSCGKCVRGLLCARCNSAIGLVDEDLAVIERMGAYLKRPRWAEASEPGEQGGLWAA